MTNVPEPIREAWKEVYKLFDVSYNMDGSEQSWIVYWERANKLIQQYGDDIQLLEMFTAIAHMIEVFINQRKTGNKCLSWNADEDYPHPRSESEITLGKDCSYGN